MFKRGFMKFSFKSVIVFFGEEIRRQIYSSHGTMATSSAVAVLSKAQKAWIRSGLGTTTILYARRAACYVYSLARERGKERDVPTVYVCIYVYGEDTARLFAQPRKQYIDVQQPINGSLKEGFYRKASGASLVDVPVPSCIAQTHIYKPHTHIAVRVHVRMCVCPSCMYIFNGASRSTALLWFKVNAFIEPFASSGTPRRHNFATNHLTLLL